MKKPLKLISIFCLLILIIAPVKIYAANNNEKITVVPGGESFGIKLFSSGVIVTKTESFKSGTSLSALLKKQE